jgi:hypothetical protein
MAIKNRDGYPGYPYCEDRPAYDVSRGRPTYSCKFCWRIWDDKQKKRLTEMAKELAELRAVVAIRMEALRGLTRELVRGVREEEM